MNRSQIIAELKIQFAYWLGLRAANPLNYDAERETFTRMRNADSEYQLLRLYLETSETYNELSAREAWRQFRQAAFEHHRQRCEDYQYSKPSWTELLRASISEGGAK